MLNLGCPLPLLDGHKSIDFNALMGKSWLSRHCDLALNQHLAVYALVHRKGWVKVGVSRRRAMHLAVRLVAFARGVIALQGLPDGVSGNHAPASRRDSGSMRPCSMKSCRVCTLYLTILPRLLYAGPRPICLQFLNVWGEQERIFAASMSLTKRSCCSIITSKDKNQ